MDKTLEIEYKGKKYTITFPNNREYIGIQSIKANLLPQAETLTFMGAEEEFAVLLVNSFSHLKVLCPQLLKDFDFDFDTLDLINAKELSDEVYAKQIRPWYVGWLNIIFKVNKKEEKNG